MSLTPSPTDKEALTRLFRRALGLRLVLAVALHFFVNEGLFAPDQTMYDYGAARIAEYWTGESSFRTSLLDTAGPSGYYLLVAAIYATFGAWSLLPKLLNACVGGYTVRLVYRMAFQVTDDHNTAYRAATYTAFLPSMVLWSVLNIRDCWVILAVLVACEQTLRLQKEFHVRNLVALAVAAFALTQLRPYILVAVMGPIIVALFVGRGGNVVRNAVVGLLGVTILTYLTLADPSSGQLRSPDLETLQQLRTASSIEGSAFAPDADISSAGGALTFLPVGMAFFLFAPFPWMISGFRQLITLPEMLFLYWLAIPMLRGLADLLRRRLRETMPLALVAASLTFGYALGQANMGTAYRHRAQVLPFLLVFGAAGVELRRRSCQIEEMDDGEE